MDSRKVKRHGPCLQRNALYGSRRWRIVRARYLKAHPWCLHCGQPATVVDHAHGHTGDWLRRFWDEQQWQPLCAGCHGRKTIAVDAAIDGSQRRRYRAGFTPPRARGPRGAGGEKVEGAPPTSGPRWIFIPGPRSAEPKALPADSAEFVANRLRARAGPGEGAPS